MPRRTVPRHGRRRWAILIRCRRALQSVNLRRPAILRYASLPAAFPISQDGPLIIRQRLSRSNPGIDAMCHARTLLGVPGQFFPFDRPSHSFHLQAESANEFALELMIHQSSSMKFHAIQISYDLAGLLRCALDDFAVDRFRTSRFDHCADSCR
jgi:hypothetical protein